MYIYIYIYIYIHIKVSHLFCYMHTKCNDHYGALYKDKSVLRISERE